MECPLKEKRSSTFFDWLPFSAIPKSSSPNTFWGAIWIQITSTVPFYVIFLARVVSIFSSFSIRSSCIFLLQRTREFVLGTLRKPLTSLPLPHMFSVEFQKLLKKTSPEFLPPASTLPSSQWFETATAQKSAACSSENQSQTDLKSLFTLQETLFRVPYDDPLGNVLCKLRKLAAWTFKDAAGIPGTLQIIGLMRFKKKNWKFTREDKKKISFFEFSCWDLQTERGSGVSACKVHVFLQTSPQKRVGRQKIKKWRQE